MMRLLLALLAVFAGIALLTTQTAVAYDKLPGNYSCVITDASQNRLGNASTDSTGDVLTYTLAGGSAETWNWDANLDGYTRGNIVWKFNESVGAWIREPIPGSGGGATPSQGGYFYGS